MDIVPAERFDVCLVTIMRYKRKFIIKYNAEKGAHPFPRGDNNEIAKIIDEI